MKEKTLFPLLALALLPSLWGLAGCGGSLTPVALQYGQLWDYSLDYSANNHFYCADQSKDIAERTLADYSTPYSKLASLVDSKENFVCVVLGSSTCSCWQSWRTGLLYPYMKANNLQVYLIKHETLDAALASELSVYGLEYASSYDDIAIFKEGSLAYQKANKVGESFHEDYATFKSWMDERIVAPKMLYVDDSQLSSLYKGKIKGSDSSSLLEFTIYFSRSGCGDCSYLSQNFLRSYLASTANLSTSYIIDLDAEGIRLKNGEYDKELYSAWKDAHGLSYSESNPAGFATGYVPTLYHIACNAEGKMTGEDVIDGGAVYCNDTLSLLDGGNYSVSSSYYTSDRLESQELSYLKDSSVENKIVQGIEVPAADVTVYDGPYYAWNHEAAAKYHDPILKAFLDSYIGENK